METQPLAETAETAETADPGGQLGGLVHRIGDDLKTIASDEVELVRDELSHTAKIAAAELAVTLLFGMVALMGFGMLCVAAVAALEPVIASLALRLLLGAIVYLVIGGSIAGAVGSRLKRDAVPDLKLASFEARRTLAGAASSLQHG